MTEVIVLIPAIDSYNELEDGGDGEGGDDWREGGESVTMRLTSLERILKCLENVSDRE